MTAAGATTYEWDAANRLKSVNSGSLGSYGYDGNGKRGKRKSESGTLSAEVNIEAERRREMRMCFVPSFWNCLQLVRIKAEFTEVCRETGGALGFFGRRSQEFIWLRLGG